DPASTYGRSSGSAPSGILYRFCLSHVSSPAASVADRIRIWYSPTLNRASILTVGRFVYPSSSVMPCVVLVGSIVGASLMLYWYGTGHGSCSQYSTSRG